MKTAIFPLVKLLGASHSS